MCFFNLKGNFMLLGCIFLFLDGGQSSKFVIQIIKEEMCNEVRIYVKK